jgi:hypothetical protein
MGGNVPEAADSSPGDLRMSLLQLFGQFARCVRKRFQATRRGILNEHSA